MKSKQPIVFVTGIGQTWTSLRGDMQHRWNLFARDPSVVFGRMPMTERAQLLRTAAEITRYLLGGRAVDQKQLQRALTAILRFCRVDDAGNLPNETVVHIYGARSFDELSRIHFYTGEPTSDVRESLLDRLLRDVPCRDFMAQYGAENMYCFNYSPFTDIYAVADALHGMLRAVLKNRPGEKVVLVPMSMGAAVTLAYLDAYYTADGPVQENYIDRIVSVVGAWDGSEGFADLLLGRVHAQWNTLVFEEYLPKQTKHPWLLRRLTAHPERVNTLLRQLLDALLDGILLRSSAFLALVPQGRWEEMYPYLFSDTRFARNTRLPFLQSQADRFIQAQKNLRARMQQLHDACGVSFAFVGGTGLRPGEESSDFQFMRYLHCADRTDTDGVLQLSSSMPFCMDSPESYVQDFAVFDRQMHEIGSNPVAMQYIFDLASGKNHPACAANNADPDTISAAR